MLMLPACDIHAYNSEIGVGASVIVATKPGNMGDMREGHMLIMLPSFEIAKSKTKHHHQIQITLTIMVIGK
jgi:hypothetical protein